MAKGKTHDRFSLLIGSVCTGILLGFERSWHLVLAFSAGWLFATLIFSPDTDIMPKKRAGVLRYVLYPYSLIFKHRGVSHMIFFGTLSRVLYGLLVFIILVYILNGLGHIDFSTGDFVTILKDFIRNFDYSKDQYKLVIWPYIGMFLADLTHIFLDHLTSLRKRIRYLFR